MFKMSPLTSLALAAVLALSACNDGANPVPGDERAANNAVPGTGAGNSATGATGGTATSPGVDGAQNPVAATPGTSGAPVTQQGAAGAPRDTLGTPQPGQTPSTTPSR